MRRPLNAVLHPATAGAAKAWQPKRDQAEHGRNPVGPVVLDLAQGGAGPALRPPGGMIPALGRDHRLLNLGQQAVVVRNAQAEIREVAKISGAVALQYIDASARTIDPRFPPGAKPTQHNFPKLAAVPSQRASSWPA